MSKGRVMVTGCAGYIGSVLCQRLIRDGFEVLGVDSLTYHNQSAVMHLIGERKFNFLLHDVRDVEGLRPFIQQADAIIPLAAVVGAPACDRDPGYATQVNSLAIRKMVRELSPHQRVIYPNTNSGYGQTDGKTFVTEADPLKPISLYGATKVEAEQAVLAHPLGVSLRLATVFGPSPRMRFDLMVNDFTCKLARDRKLEVFEPHFKRNFVHVRDASRVFVRMLCDHRLDGAFNVGLPDANMSKLELAYYIAGLLGLYPHDVVSVVDGEDPDKRNYLVSTQKLLSTGFEFHYTLSQGVQDVAGMLSLLAPHEIDHMRNV